MNWTKMDHMADLEETTVKFACWRRWKHHRIDDGLGMLFPRKLTDVSEGRSDLFTDVQFIQCDHPAIAARAVDISGHRG